MAANPNQQQREKGVNKRNISQLENEVNSWLLRRSERKKTTKELVALIISEIEAPPFYYQKVNEILNHLQQIMKFFYRNLDVKLELFGSSATNLAVKDSDVDIFLNFRGNLPKPPEVLVRSLKNQIRKFGYFIKSIPIFARVPIVQCVHQSGISCDLSFSHQLGVVNSHLIKFLLSIDERIRPLIHILKYIIKNRGLIGNNALSSFSVICLIVFFLQTVEDPIIPALCYLQSLSTKKKMIGNWDTSFTTEISHLPTVGNQLSVIGLMQKFFEFYSTFEFGFYVISLFTAKKYLKPIFSNPSSLPEEFLVYKANIAKNESYKFDYNKFMCIQSPFEHCNNITRNTKEKIVLQFQNFCCINATIGQELLKQNNLEENEMKYLMKLFSQESEIPKRKKLKAEDVVIFVGEKIIFDNWNCSEDNLRNKWSKHIFNTVKDILCKVMKCDIDIHSELSDNDLSLINNGKVINCKLHYHGLLTKKRNEVRSEIKFPQNISAIEKEEIVSDYLCNTLLKGAKKSFLRFKVKCSVKKKPTCFCMTLESEEMQKRNIHLVLQIFQFIQNHFPKWIQ